MQGTVPFGNALTNIKPLRLHVQENGATPMAHQAGAGNTILGGEELHVVWHDATCGQEVL